MPDSIATQLSWAETVYVNDEQDDGSPYLIATLARRLGDKLRIVTCRPEAKDLSELWIRCKGDRQRFVETVNTIVEDWREPTADEKRPKPTGKVPPRYVRHGDGDDGDQEEVGALADGYRPTDVGNAERLIEAGGGRIRYIHAWGRWLVYRGGRWQVDPNNALVRQVAKRVARQLFTLAATIRRDAKRRQRRRRQGRDERPALDGPRRPEVVPQLTG